MPQYEFYTISRNARQLTFGQLFADCYSQLKDIEGGELTSLIMSQIDINDLGSPAAIIEISIPITLDDFVKLFNDPRSMISQKIIRSLNLNPHVLSSLTSSFSMKNISRPCDYFQDLDVSNLANLFNIFHSRLISIEILDENIQVGKLQCRRVDVEIVNFGNWIKSIKVIVKSA